MTNIRLHVAIRCMISHCRHCVPGIPFTLAVLLLTACAGTPPAGDTQASADQECVYVRVTGSNLPVKQCRSRAERDAIAAREREAAQNSARDIQLLDEAGDRSLGADSLP